MDDAGLKIERSVGTNELVLQIQNGAKIAFKNITVNGKIAPEDDGKNANNRAIYVLGSGTEVICGISTGDSSILTINGGRITGKRSASDGGGVYLSDHAESKFTMTGGTNMTGAAVYKNATAVLEVQGISATEKTAIDMR
jgi:hypothetical protein